MSTFFVGTNTGVIYSCKYEETGNISLVQTLNVGGCPSFLCVNKAKTHLYAVAETSDFEGEKETGGIVAYKLVGKVGDVDGQELTLTKLNATSSNGTHPCHVLLDPSDKFLFTACYTGATHSAYKIEGDGSIGACTSTITCEGKGPKPEQDKAHPHEVMMYGDGGKFVVVPDLGSDKWRLYNFSKEGKLIPNSNCEFVEAVPGSGPRHIKFSSSGKYAYGANEHSNTVSVFEVNNETGALKIVQEVTTIDDKSPTPTYVAEIHLSPCEKFLYVSNRAKEANGSIAVFSVSENSKSLTLVQIAQTHGKFPRYFELRNEFILVANQLSDDIVVLKRDLTTGKIGDSPVSILEDIKVPTCITFL